MNTNWYKKSSQEIFKILDSSEQGLAKNEAANRLEKHGSNKLPEGKTDSLSIIFLRQFQNPLIYILIAASIIVYLMGDITDSIIIFAVLIFNAIVGTIQEGKAQNTLLALKRFVETKSTVLREGKEFIVPDTKLVPGDIIILQEGEKVPVDARLIATSNLKIDEASLTGESISRHKSVEAIHKDNIPTTEQTNMLFKGTHVLSGNGKAIVVATGTNTIIGKISEEIAAIDTEIPLKKSVRDLSKLIIIFVASISALLFAFGSIAGIPVTEMFATVVSLAVSIIPEGLPIVITLVLATGVWRMSKRNALIKKLQAVETLGQTKVIAVDKTGTITKNEIVVQKVYANKRFFDIEGIGYEPEGYACLNKNVIGSIDHPELLLIGKMSAFLSNAHVMFSEEEKAWHTTGDPTEAAMLILAGKLGTCKDDLEKTSKRIGEISFDYKSKYHAILQEDNGEKLLAVAGAPETIVNLSEKIWTNGKSLSLDKHDKKELENIFNSMSKEGLRVVALAKIDDPPETIAPKNIKSLTFVGFLGMKDTLRPEVKEAMQKTTDAGIKVVMITGDHKLTAQTIAKEAGIYKDGDLILTGQDIDILSDEELTKKLDKTSVFARVTPEHKLKIINAYKNTGKIVAMTGDGVNDAPSLVAADLGVAMGKIGTEVAKEAADIVLLDDNFGSIVSAVEEGRNIYKTIKKVLLYLFSTSLGETLTIIGALLLGFPLPILPAQIIWLNFVTDGFLDVALIMEPKEKGLLRAGFKHSKNHLVDKLMTKRMIIMSIPMMIGTLILFKCCFEESLTKGWTVSFTTLAVFQWFNAWNCRHSSESIFKMNPFSNKYLLGATAIIIILQLLAIYNPLMQKLLHTTALNLKEWLFILAASTSIIFVEEIRKFFYRRKIRKNTL